MQALIARNLQFVRCIHKQAAVPETLLRMIKKNHVAKKYSEAMEKFHKRILFNSVIAIQNVRIKKLDRIIGAQEKKRAKLQNSKVESLPLVLSQLSDHNLLEPDEKEELQMENLKRYKRVDYPFSRFLEVDKSYENRIAVSEDLDAVRDRKSLEIHNNWLRDYELYDESEEELTGMYGTPDPHYPVSDVPCHGCGALLHCKEPSIPGYLPSELFQDLSPNELRLTICQRCHFLEKYNTAINITVSPQDYVNMLYQKDTSSLAVIMVDLLDFPCSIFPNLAEILGKNRPVFVVGNKVDLLPRDSPSFLDHLKECLKLEAMKMGFQPNSIRHVTLVSAKTGYGIEELITKLHTNWKYRGDVYLIGCTNVGKSSLFNRLIKSDYCKSDASNLIKRATSSIWPGTTIKLLKFPILRPSDYRIYLRTRRIIEEKKFQAIAENERREQAIKHKRIEDATLIGHIGRTFETKEILKDPGAMNHEGGFSGNKFLEVFDETKKEYEMSKWCYDTPGVMHSDQILPFLTTDEIIKVLPKRMMQARVLYVKSGMSLFIAGLARLDIIDVPPLTRLIVFASLDLPLTIVNTVDAEEFYESFLGSEILGVPMDLGEDRFKNWPKLESTFTEIVVEGVDKHVSTCDFVMSSAGWIGVNLPREQTGKFRPFTLGGRGIHVRNPSILPNGWVLRGQRVRDSPAYTLGKAFSYRRLLPRGPKIKNK